MAKPLNCHTEAMCQVQGRHKVMPIIRSHLRIDGTRERGEEIDRWVSGTGA